MSQFIDCLIFSSVGSSFGKVFFSPLVAHTQCCWYRELRFKLYRHHDDLLIETIMAIVGMKIPIFIPKILSTTEDEDDAFRSSFRPPRNSGRYCNR
jgi:hypothetical protein